MYQHTDNTCAYLLMLETLGLCVTLVKGQGVEILGIQLLEEVFFLNECPFGLGVFREEVI